MLTLLLSEVAGNGEPWWIKAALGSLGALVLSIVGNIVQYRKTEKQEEAWEKKVETWDTERQRLNDAIKAESDRSTEYGERTVALMTKATIHLEANPQALEKIGDTVTNEHLATRTTIEKAFKDIEKELEKGGNES